MSDRPPRALGCGIIVAFLLLLTAALWAAWTWLVPAIYS